MNVLYLTLLDRNGDKKFKPSIFSRENHISPIVHSKSESSFATTNKKFYLKKYNSLYKSDIALSVFIHPPETLNKVNKYIQTLSFS